MKKREKTTILFVSKGQQAIKPLQVSSKLISHWKKYAIAAVLIFISFLIAITYLASDKIRQHEIQVSLSERIQTLKVLMSQTDTAVIREKFSQIDEELNSLNKILKARGLAAIVNEPLGGEDAGAILSAAELADFYQSYLEEISYNLPHTPIGYPFDGKITSVYGPRNNPFTGKNLEAHLGLDIKGPNGSPVKTMAKGKVIFAGIKGGYGNCIIIKHANGFETLYGHLSKIKVKKGHQVEIGEHIGNIGSTGRSTGPHLHYEVHQNGKRINPQSFLTLN